MTQAILITEHGINIIREKLAKLKTESRETLTEMTEVRDNCLSSEDTSEVYEYQQKIETIQDQITQYNAILNNCTVVDVSEIQTDKVQFGSVVTLLDLDTDEVKKYRVVSSYESDPKAGMISYTSPIGKAMLGLELDDIVELEVAGKIKEYEITDITSFPM